MTRNSKVNTRMAERELETTDLISQRFFRIFFKFESTQVLRFLNPSRFNAYKF